MKIIKKSDKIKININSLEEEIKEHRALQISCFNEAESKTLLRKLHNLGYQWRSGTSLLNYESSDVPETHNREITYRIKNSSISYSLTTPSKYCLKYKKILY